MSDLYTSSSDARRETTGIGKTGNFWEDWYTDRVRDGIKFNQDTQEYDKKGMAFWGGLLGRNNDDAIRQIEEGKDAVRDSTKIEQTLSQYPGVTDEQILEASGGKKLTGSNVKGVVSEAVRTRGEKLTPAQEAEKRSRESRDSLALTAQTDATNIARQQLAHAITSSKNTADTARAQFAYLQAKDDKRFALQNAQRLDEKAEARRDRLDMLDRQDHRYDQQMERYDKRRRQESIQGLVGGLAALGAAFAV